METRPEDPVGRSGIQIQARDHFFRRPTDVLPCHFPLFLAPIVVGKSDTESGIADPVHHPQTQVGSETLAEVVFHKQPSRRDAARFAKQGLGIDSVVENVGEQDGVKGGIAERDGGAVENFYRYVRFVAGKNVQASDLQIRPLGEKHRRKRAIATTHIKDAGTSRREFGEPGRENGRPPV